MDRNGYRTHSTVKRSLNMGQDKEMSITRKQVVDSMVSLFLA